MFDLVKFLQSAAALLVVFAALSWVCGKLVEVWHIVRNRHGTQLHSDLARCFGEKPPGTFTNYFYWHPLIEPLSQPSLWRLRPKDRAQGESRLDEVYPQRHLPGHIAPETFAAVMLDPFPWPSTPESLVRMLEANRLNGVSSEAAESRQDIQVLATDLLGKHRRVKASDRWRDLLAPQAEEFDPDFLDTPVAAHVGWQDGSEEDQMTRLENCWTDNRIVPDRLRARIISLMREAEGDIDSFRTATARWYREEMDRLSGRFQRKSMLKAFGVALVVCLLLNVDMLAIGDGLLADLRPDAPAPAEGAATAGQRPAEGTATVSAHVFRPIWKVPYAGPAQTVLTLLGILIAAALAALGAPFWYDLLDKVSRRSGRGPAGQS